MIGSLENDIENEKYYKEIAESENKELMEKIRTLENEVEVAKEKN